MSPDTSEQLIYHVSGLDLDLALLRKRTREVFIQNSQSHLFVLLALRKVQLQKALQIFRNLAVCQSQSVCQGFFGMLEREKGLKDDKNVKKTAETKKKENI